MPKGTRKGMAKTTHKGLLKPTLATVMAIALTGTVQAQGMWRATTCASLYLERNQFFHRKGLCFTKPEAIAAFPSNPRTCVYDDSRDMPMSSYETQQMRRFVEIERELGCR